MSTRPLDSKYVHYVLLIIFVVSVCLLMSSNIALANTGKTLDLRIVVDISGSMKNTDPQNLRRPAVRLLSGLVPEGAKAGLWTFGKQVNMAVKISAVNDAWRKQLQEQSMNISSAGLFTNIEQALRNASYDWNTPDKQSDRNLILLTDGHVDISKEASANNASRRKILKEIVPRLEKMGVKVHTIALSDDVDETLLGTISSYTNGLYEKVNNADELNGVFLRMLEQSAALDTLPIENNTFNVDDRIRDMTLLIFNKQEAEPVSLVSPDNQLIRKDEAAENISWHRDQGFDLITVKEPQPGRWKFNAPEDKNNRVVVATNLKLAINELPSSIMSGDSVQISAQLLEDNKLLTNNDLLAQFDFQVISQTSDDDKKQYNLIQNGQKFEYVFPSLFGDGIHELIIKAVSQTTEREVRHRINIYTVPASIELEKGEDDRLLLTISPKVQLFKENSLSFKMLLNDETEVVLNQRDESWVGQIENTYLDTEYNLNIKAQRADGQDFDMSFNNILTLESSVTNIELPVSNKSGDKVAGNAEKDTIAGDEDNNDNKKSQKENKEGVGTTGFTIAAVLVSNLLLLVIVVLGYLFFQRRKNKMAAELGNMVEKGDIQDDSENDSTSQAKKKGKPAKGEK